MTKKQARWWKCPDCPRKTNVDAKLINIHLKGKTHQQNQTGDCYVCPDCKITVSLEGKCIIEHLNSDEHNMAIRSKDSNVLSPQSTKGRNPSSDKEYPRTSSRTMESSKWRIGSSDLKYIQTLNDLKTAIQCDPILSGQLSHPNYNTVCTVDCEGVPESLDLVQIATSTAVYVFDCVRLQPEVVCRHLRPVFESLNVIKVFHDLHQDAVALQKYGIKISAVLDSQLVAEYMWGKHLIGFNDMLLSLGLQSHPSKSTMKNNMRKNPDIWKTRPLDNDCIEYAAWDAYLLLQAYPRLKKGADKAFHDILTASLARARFAIDHGGCRSVCFDKACAYRMSSKELLEILRPSDVYENGPIECKSDVSEVIDLLPTDLKYKLLHNVQPAPLAKYSITDLFRLDLKDEQLLNGEPTSLAKYFLSDIVLDIGRRPWCWIGNERIMLSNDETRLVNGAEVDSIMKQLGKFGTDNRAGLKGKLHRFSCMRDRNGGVIGLTIRIGRWYRGNAGTLIDILLGSEKSVLFLGVPGSGKTTIVRETVRILADHHNVCVVDTSNEIGGDGPVPHHCIGLARRMMVPSLDAQSRVMVECVQNHTPHIMVIDEIGRPREVEAARTVKQRGVRIIASAHGDLRSLIKNKELRGLVGSIESVTLGDDMAKEEAARKSSKGGTGIVSKTQTRRTGEPTFDVIVEVARGKFQEWRVIKDAAKAVDNILDGVEYSAEMRVLDTKDSTVILKSTKA